LDHEDLLAGNRNAKLLEQIGKPARDRGIAPRKLIRAVLAEHFAGDRSAQQNGSADQSNPQRGFDQILFDSLAPGSRAEKRAIPTKLSLLKTPNMPKG
jgi:hypothetical protein